MVCSFYLTSRYITSPETVMDMDISRIAEKGFVEYFKEIEEANLSDVFWKIGLVQNLETSAINSPFSMFWHPRCGPTTIRFS